MFKKNRNLLSILTLIFFMVSNYTNVFASTLTRTQASLASKFVEEYQKLNIKDDNLMKNEISEISLLSSNSIIGNQSNNKLDAKVQIFLTTSDDSDSSIYNGYGVIDDINMDNVLNIPNLNTYPVQTNNVYKSCYLLFTPTETIDSLSLIIDEDYTNGYTYTKSWPSKPTLKANKTYLLKLDYKLKDSSIKFIATPSSSPNSKKVLTYKLEEVNQPSTTPFSNPSFPPIGYDFDLNGNWSEALTSINPTKYSSIKTWINNNVMPTDKFTYSCTTDDSYYNSNLSVNLDYLKDSINTNISIFNVDNLGFVTFHEESLNTDDSTFDDIKIDDSDLNVDGGKLHPNKTYNLVITSPEELSFDTNTNDITVESKEHQISIGIGNNNSVKIANPYKDTVQMTNSNGTDQTFYRYTFKFESADNFGIDNNITYLKEGSHAINVKVTGNYNINAKTNTTIVRAISKYIDVKTNNFNTISNYNNLTIKTSNLNDSNNNSSFIGPLLDFKLLPGDKITEFELFFEYESDSGKSFTVTLNDIANRDFNKTLDDGKYNVSIINFKTQLGYDKDNIKYLNNNEPIDSTLYLQINTLSTKPDLLFDIINDSKNYYFNSNNIKLNYSVPGNLVDTKTLKITLTNPTANFKSYQFNGTRTLTSEEIFSTSFILSTTESSGSYVIDLSSCFDDTTPENSTIKNGIAYNLTVELVSSELPEPLKNEFIVRYDNEPPTVKDDSINFDDTVWSSGGSDLYYVSTNAFRLNFNFSEKVVSPKIKLFNNREIILNDGISHSIDLNLNELNEYISQNPEASNQEFTVSFNGKDFAGNSLVAKTITIKLDNLGPNIKVLYDDNECKEFTSKNESTDVKAYAYNTNYKVSKLLNGLNSTATSGEFKVLIDDSNLHSTNIEEITLGAGVTKYIVTASDTLNHNSSLTFIIYEDSINPRFEFVTVPKKNNTNNLSYKISEIEQLNDNIYNDKNTSYLAVVVDSFVFDTIGSTVMTYKINNKAYTGVFTPCNLLNEDSTINKYSGKTLYVLSPIGKVPNYDNLQGNHEISFDITDFFARSTPASYKFKVDNIKPTLDLTAINASKKLNIVNSIYHTNGNIDINYKFNNNKVGYKDLTVEVYDASVTDFSTATPLFVIKKDNLDYSISDIINVNLDLDSQLKTPSKIRVRTILSSTISLTSEVNEIIVNYDNQDSTITLSNDDSVIAESKMTYFTENFIPTIKIDDGYKIDENNYINNFDSSKAIILNKDDDLKFQSIKLSEFKVKRFGESESDFDNVSLILNEDKTSFNFKVNNSTTLTEGDYSATIEVMDLNGNVSVATYKFGIETSIKPFTATISNTSEPNNELPKYGDIYYAKNNATVNVNLSNQLSGYSSLTLTTIYINKDGISVSNDTSYNGNLNDTNNYPIQFTLPYIDDVDFSKDNFITLELKATTPYGNSNKPIVLKLVYDVASPKAVFTLVGDGVNDRKIADTTTITPTNCIDFNPTLKFDLTDTNLMPTFDSNLYKAIEITELTNTTTNESYKSDCKIIKSLPDNDGIFQVVDKYDNSFKLKDGLYNLSIKIQDKSLNSKLIYYHFAIDTSKPTLANNLLSFEALKSDKIENPPATVNDDFTEIVASDFLTTVELPENISGYSKINLDLNIYDEAKSNLLKIISTEIKPENSENNLLDSNKYSTNFEFADLYGTTENGITIFPNLYLELIVTITNGSGTTSDKFTKKLKFDRNTANLNVTFKDANNSKYNEIGLNQLITKDADIILNLSDFSINSGNLSYVGKPNSVSQDGKSSLTIKNFIYSKGYADPNNSQSNELEKVNEKDIVGFKDLYGDCKSFKFIYKDSNKDYEFRAGIYEIDFTVIDIIGNSKDYSYTFVIDNITPNVSNIKIERDSNDENQVGGMLLYEGNTFPTKENIVYTNGDILLTYNLIDNNLGYEKIEIKLKDENGKILKVVDTPVNYTGILIPTTNPTNKQSYQYKLEIPGGISKDNPNIYTIESNIISIGNQMLENGSSPGLVKDYPITINHYKVLPSILLKNDNEEINDGRKFAKNYSKSIQPVINLSDTNFDFDSLIVNDSKLNSIKIDTISRTIIKDNNLAPTTLNDIHLVKNANTMQFNFVNSQNEIVDFDYGNYVVNLSATDKNGNTLKYSIKFYIEKEPIAITATTNLYNKNNISYSNKTNFNITANLPTQLLGYKSLKTVLYSNNIPLQTYSGDLKTGTVAINLNNLNPNAGDISKYKDEKLILKVIATTTFNTPIEFNINFIYDTTSASIALKCTIAEENVDATGILKEKPSKVLVNISDNNIAADMITVKSSENLINNSVRLDKATKETVTKDAFDITDKITLKAPKATSSTSNNANQVYFELLDNAIFDTGRYKFSFSCQDLAGNTQTKDFEFIIDTKPTSGDYSITYLKNGNTQVVTKDTITYSPSDATFTFNVSGNISGFNDNSVGQSSISILYQSSPNANKIPIDLSNNLATGSTGVTIDKNRVLFDSSKNVKTSILKLSKQGIYTISYKINANNNISELSGDFTLYIDKEKPNVSLTSVNTSGTNDNKEYIKTQKANLEFAASDMFAYSSSTITITNVITGKTLSPETFITTTGTYTNFNQDSQGEFLVKITSVDIAGNTGEDTLYLIVDTVSPVVHLTNNIKLNSIEGINYTNQILPCSYDVVDDYKNETTYKLKVGGIEYSKTTPISGDGTKNIIVEAYDYAGNRGFTELSYVLDTVAPEISFKDVVPEKYYNVDVAPKYEATDNHLDKSSITSNINGVTYNNNTLSADGKYTLTASAKDYAGNITQSSLTFVIDKVAPVITIEGILENEVNGGTLVPTILTDDPSATVTSFLNGESYYGEPIRDTKRFTLLVNAVDKAGNFAKKAVTFMLDSFGSDIAVEFDGEGDFNKNIYEPGVVPKINVTKQATYTTLLLNGIPYNGEAIYEEGDYVLEIKAIDYAGNETNQKIEFTVLKGSSRPAIVNFILSTPFMVSVGGLLVIFAIIGSTILIKSRKAKTQDE